MPSSTPQQHEQCLVEPYSSTSSNLVMTGDEYVHGAQVVAAVCSTERIARSVAAARGLRDHEIVPVRLNAYLA